MDRAGFNHLIYNQAVRDCVSCHSIFAINECCGAIGSAQDKGKFARSVLSDLDAHVAIAVIKLLGGIFKSYCGVPVEEEMSVISSAEAECAARSATEMFEAIRFLITASSITTLSAVRRIACKSPTPA